MNLDDTYKRQNNKKNVYYYINITILKLVIRVRSLKITN